MKVISGGQTGADQAGLAAARGVGLETGGWAPKGWRTDAGPAEQLLRGYGLQEWAKPGYAARTAANVTHSDGTVWFGHVSPGFNCTSGACRRYQRPFIIESTPEELIAFIAHHRVGILNVAGNRERLNPGIFGRVSEFLRGVFDTYK